MTIKSAIQFCWHGGLEQIDHGIITVAQLLGCFFDISDIFFYVIISWVKGESSPSFMQMLNIAALGREIRTEMFCKLFPVAMEIASKLWYHSHAKWFRVCLNLSMY